MSKRQTRLIVVLIFIVLVIVVGGGYYVLRDSGIIEKTSNTGTDAAQAEAADTSVDSSIGLPPAWTPTPSGVSDIDFTQWGLQLSDLPLGFKKEPIDDPSIPPSLTDEIEGISLIKEFAFSKEGDSPQFIGGMTLLIPSQRGQVEFDEVSSTLEFVIEDILSTLDHNGILEQNEIPGLTAIGDSSYGQTCVLDMEAVEMRVDVISFRRGVAGAILFVFYIDGYPLEIPIQDLAEILDQRIIPTLAENP